MPWRIYRSRMSLIPFTAACAALPVRRTAPLNAAVLAAVERALQAWEWRKRLAERSETEFDVDAATLIAEARAFRDRELGSR